MSSMAKYAIAKTTFWIASILSVILLAMYVLASTEVTGYDATDLGLLTKLPIAFWIGLSYLGLLLFVGRKSRLQTVIVVVLISFYLFGLPVLMRENKAEYLGISYWLSSKGAYLTSTGHLDFNVIDPWDFYNWPGFFLVAGFLSSFTGLPVTVFADYFPLLIIALLGIITYSILKLRFNPLYSSLGALWVIASLWTGQHYFSPQAIAYLMYFAVLLLLAKLLLNRKSNSTFSLLIIFLFTASVITHLLTSFVIMTGVIAIFVLFQLFPEKVKMPHSRLLIVCILIVSIFFAYQALIIHRSFYEITLSLYGQILRQETPISLSLQARAGGSTVLGLQHAGAYGITLVNVVTAVLAILATVISLFHHKKEAKRDLLWIAWIIVAGILSVSLVYGAEVINRAFMFMLLPTSYFAIKFLRKTPVVLISVLVILTFILIPALYSTQNYAYVPTIELKGTAFYTKYAPSRAPFFYEPVSPFLPYGVINGTQISLTLTAGVYSLPSQEFVSKTAEQAKFIISSNGEKNLYLYFYGFDPLENLNLDDNQNRIFDNGGFRIYNKIP
jgi:hypothetical protein